MKSLKKTLSVCMIVKNEETYIKECLESIKNVSDQIVILDTGSTDKTLEIAKLYNAEIHFFEWVNDFSAARNASVGYAKGDWILWLDADERLTPDSQTKLLPELISTDKPLIYKVRIENETNDAASARTSTAHRLFNNNRGIRFKNRIHEQLYTDGRHGPAEIRKSAICLKHLGYALEGEKKQVKDARNLKLLYQMVAENPNDAYAHYTLGQQLSLSGKLDESLAHLEKAFDLNQFEKEMTVSLMNVMAETYFKLNQIEKSEYFAQMSIKKETLQTGAFYMLYRIANEKKNYFKALEAIEQIRANNKKISGTDPRISTDVIIADDKLLYTKAILLEKAGKPEDALRSLKKVIEYSPYNEQVLNMAVGLTLKLGLLSEAEKMLAKIVGQNPARTDAFDTLGTVYIKQLKFDQAINIYEKLNKKMPANNAVKRKLAGLYLKTGSEKKARQLLEINAD